MKKILIQILDFPLQQWLPLFLLCINQQLYLIHYKEVPSVVMLSDDEQDTDEEQRANQYVQAIALEVHTSVKSTDNVPSTGKYHYTSPFYIK